jgi:hypothetical protein
MVRFSYDEALEDMFVHVRIALDSVLDGLVVYFD